MEETEFLMYISSLLQESGHMMQTTPIYANQSIQTVLFLENDRTVSLSATDCATLSYVSSISLLTQLQWGKADTVQLYAVTAHFPYFHRSQDIAETHRILQSAWRNRHSIVFFQNEDMWAVSFADDTMSHVLSDWFPFETDDEAVLARLSIENMSLSDSTAYFLDFQYAMVREYYRYPISRSEARFALLPRDYRLEKYNEDTDVLTADSMSVEEYRTLLREEIFYYEFRYGNDYVTPHYINDGKVAVEREATHHACEEAERQAKTKAICQIAMVLQQVIEKAKLAEIERQMHEAMASHIAAACQQIVERAKHIEEAEREAKEKAERQAKAEAERLAREAADKRERMRCAHEERVKQLQKQCDIELDTVQSALSAVTLRLAEIEQSMTRLHIFQFSKKKAMRTEQTNLEQKEKKLRLLYSRINNSFVEQLKKENDSYAQALAAEKKT